MRFFTTMAPIGGIAAAGAALAGAQTVGHVPAALWVIWAVSAVVTVAGQSYRRRLVQV
ncbi:hypothetical protein ACF1DY_01020 [Streptomyces albus]|uniref:hypothetical protein n=1 Tax=Streptomyces albus TaxID=1888 RepID=UPI0036F6C4B6